MNITYTTTSCVCQEDLFNDWDYPATQIGGFVSSTNSNPGVSGQDSLTPSTIYTATFGFGGFYDNGNSQCTYGNNPTALLYGSGKQRSGVCDASASQRWIDSSDDTGATIDSLNWNVGTANTGSAMIHFAVSLNAPIGNFPPLHVFTTFNGINEGCIYCIDPPDVQLAVGPSQIIELVNLAYQVYNKGGTAITSPASLPAFFRTNFQTSGDPKVLFDSLSGRFFASLMDNSANYLEIAVSDTNNATGTWHFYRINAVCPPGHGCNVDQPIIGVSNDKFVVSINEADSTTGACFCAEYFVMNKRQMTENATTPAVQEFGPDSSTAFIHPAQALSSSDDLFMVVAGERPGEQTTNIATLYRVTGLPPNAGVTTSTFTLAAVTNPVSAVEPNGGTVWGNCGSFNCADARVQTAALFNGKLWFAFMDQVSGTDAIRLAEIDTQAGTLVQSFDWVLLNQQNYFEYLYYPALTMDAMGNMALVYGYSDQIDYPSIAVDEQALTDGINSMQLPQTLLSSTVNAGSGRYGDYFGAAIDPANTTEIWVAGEYNFPNSSSCLPSCWGTEIAGMSTTSLTGSGDSSSLAIERGTSAVSNVTLTSSNAFHGSVAITPQTTISITATSIDDNIPRTFGLLIDAKLDQQFWNSQPSSVFNADGCSPVTYSHTYTLSSGSHFLEFGVSAFVGHWHVQIALNGVVLASVDTYVNGHVHAAFSLGGITISPVVSGGPTVSLSANSRLLSQGGSATITLTVSTTRSTPTGTYTVTVTATSGGLSHSTTITVTVHS